MRKELPKVYDPREVEPHIYQMWMDNGCFKADADPKKKPFSIVMPPPNVTGQLHMGHAMDSTLQDILTRFKRMQGYSALWLPGTDHAGIATQIKVEERLREEEHLTRYDLGREKFLERVWAWKEKYGNRIVEQQKKMGASCDWSRSRFTMDEGCSQAVREAFCELYDKGLIYKGSRIINWCPHCLTALSDAEVEYTDKPGHLWYIRYPLADGSGDIVVATTRPETMMGDTGVAVNPEDEKFKHLIGKTCILPIMNREIPIVGDDYCEIGFGTGAVKMTPAHDPNDFEVGLRHNLDTIRVLDDNGVVNANGGKLVVVPADTNAFQVQLDEVEQRITPHTQAIIVNSPNNPSGVVYTEETLLDLAFLLERKSVQYGHPIYIIADEPYRELVYGGVKVPFIPCLYKNTIVCYSYSKSLSLPGERIGYVYVPSFAEDSTAVYATVSGAARAMGHVCPPTLIQKVVGLCAQEQPDLQAYDENRTLLYDSLRAMGYECAKPDGAFYLFVKAPGGDAGAFSEKAKREHNLLVVPADGFGCPGYFRLSYCVSNEMIRRSLPAFKAMMEAYQ